jgi:hypothetical protein
MVSDASSSFLESGLLDDGHAVQAVTVVELAGQLAGDIGSTLQQLDRNASTATPRAQY